MQAHLKRVLLVVGCLVGLIWTLSLQRTQSIQVAPTQHVQFVIEESAFATPSPSISITPKPPSPSAPHTVQRVGGASKTPSITPTPYTVFIRNSLHITKERNRTHYYDTTLSTPLEISLDELRGNITSDILNITIRTHPLNGSLSILPNLSVKYTPKPLFQGINTLRYQLEYLDDTTNETLLSEEREILLRVRIGVMLNKAMLSVPSGYLFAENTAAKTSAIKSMMTSASFSALVPEKDNWLNRRYNTCAIVGNGGSLSGRKRGAEIDAHDIVVRLNLSPLRGFEEDIGRKMNITIGNGPNAQVCWKRNATDLPHNFTYEVLAQLSFAPQYKNYTMCTPQYPWIQYSPMNYRFADLVDNILNHYDREMFNGTKPKYRSTGMLAVTAMSMICDHVSVYGFERGPNMENNYYNTTYQREWSGHSYFAEKAYFADLAKGYGLFEPYLKLYDLYKSFSYVVD